MRPTNFIRADMKQVRDQIEALDAKIKRNDVTDQELKGYEALIAKSASLISEFAEAKVEEDRAEANRREMENIFRGGITSAPTHDGSRQTKSAKGFAAAFMAQGFDPKSNPTVEVSLADAYDLKAVDLSSTTPATYRPTTLADIADLGFDRRYLWPYLPSEGVDNETAITDFRQTGSRTITGNVERALASTAEKATLDVELDAVTTQLKELAILIDGIPNQVLRSVAGITEFLNAEARYAIDNALDIHVAAQILAATPPHGLTGADIFTQVRNAITSMRANGFTPDLLVIDPTDNAALDLLQDNEARFYYGLDGRDTSTLWGLTVIERNATLAFDPLLIDSRRIGRLYLGRLRLESDPYTGFSTNQTDIRLEGTALMHVRAADAAYRIAAA